MPTTPAISSAKYSDDYTAKETESPLLVLLHGWGSSEHDLPGLVDVLNANLNHKLEYVAVRAPFSCNSPGQFDGGYAWGYAWFNDPVVPRGERDEHAKIAGDSLIKWLQNEQASGQINPERPLIILGFSQGGAMICHLLTRPELKNRLQCAIMLSGYLPFSDDNVTIIDPKLPIFHGWGDADDIVPVDESIRAKEWLAQNFATVTDKSYPGMQHSICLDETRDIVDFLNNIIH